MNQLHSRQRIFDQSDRLKNVCYEIRGPIQDIATKMESRGEKILKLNIGNPAVFGFEAPPEIVASIRDHIATTHGYSDSQGLLSARESVVERYSSVPDFPKFEPDDVYIGNGVSELINIVALALINPGDEVLIPAPDYPLWTAMTHLSGGTPVHYLCNEEDAWNPDINDIRSKITPHTKAIVVINPNNPTGAVYSEEVLREIVAVAREHQLLILADEIYDRILYDDATHHSIASLCPDLVCLTFNGLSKTYRVAGFRAAWLVITGPKDIAEQFIHGIRLLASVRLCPNTAAQLGIPGALNSKHQSIEEFIKPGGRLLEQRDVTHEALTAIPGVSCVKTKGALYTFPKFDPNVLEIYDDGQLVQDFLRAEKVLLVQGSGFNWPHPDHVRIVILPWAQELKDAVERLGNFLASYKQSPPSSG